SSCEPNDTHEPNDNTLTCRPERPSRRYCIGCELDIGHRLLDRGACDRFAPPRFSCRPNGQPSPGGAGCTAGGGSAMLAMVATGQGYTVELQEVDEPQPRSNEAIVEVRAISLNRGEVMALGAAAEGTRLGWDVAGEV